MNAAITRTIHLKKEKTQEIFLLYTHFEKHSVVGAQHVYF